MRFSAPTSSSLSVISSAGSTASLGRQPSFTRGSQRSHPYKRPSAQGKPLQRSLSSKIIPGGFPLTPQTSHSTVVADVPAATPTTNTTPAPHFFSFGSPFKTTPGQAFGFGLPAAASFDDAFSSKSPLKAAARLFGFPKPAIQTPHLAKPEPKVNRKREKMLATLHTGVPHLDAELEQLGNKQLTARYNAHKRAAVRRHTEQRIAMVRAEKEAENTRLRLETDRLQAELEAANARAVEFSNQTESMTGQRDQQRNLLRQERNTHRAEKAALQQTVVQLRARIQALTGQVEQERESREELATLIKRLLPASNVFEQYDYTWTRLKARQVPHAALSVDGFAWPVENYTGHDCLTKAAVKDFLLNQKRPGATAPGTSEKSVFRSEVLKYHSDKFSTLVLPTIIPEQRAQAVEVAEIVSRHLVELNTAAGAR